MILTPATAGGRKGPGYTDLVVDFAFGNVPGQMLLGKVPAKMFVECVAMRITTPFDRPVLLEVGRLAAPAELMLAADNNPAIVDVYRVWPDQQYVVATDVYLTLTPVGLSPTAGSGHVTLYLS